MRKLTQRGAVFLFALWGLCGPLGAQAIKVNTTKSDNNTMDGFCSLREALQAALDKKKVDTCTGPDWTQIEFNVAGTITIATPAIPFPLSSNLTLTGPVTISGGGISQIFVAGSSIQLTLKKLTLIEAKMSGSGGALVTSSGGTVVIEDCKFEGNSANLGGAISNGGSDLTIKNSAFTKNEATTEGGAISTGGVVKIENTTFENNTANGGGAVNCTTGNLTISKGTFTGNKALGAANAGSFTDGGGALKSGCTLTVKDETLFELNKAEGPFGGGALLLTASYAEGFVEDTTFQDNSANGGGAILCSSGTLNVQRTFFTLNLASGAPMDMKFTRGGGAIMSACQNFIGNTMFQTNFAFGRVGGGALFVTALGGGVVLESVFDLNWAWLELGNEEKGGGGAILAHGNLTVDQSAINRNFAHAVLGGGGILFKGVQEGIVVNTSLLQNVSTLDSSVPKDLKGKPSQPGAGGAISVDEKSSVKIIASSLVQSQGLSDLHLDGNGEVRLRTTLIDAPNTKETCSGSVALILDDDVSDVSHNLQSEQFIDENGDWAGALPTCQFIPKGIIGTQVQSDGDFIVSTPGGPLKFSYPKPALFGPAHKNGNSSTCQNGPVWAKDLLNKPRSAVQCTIGAIELPVAN